MTTISAEKYINFRVAEIAKMNKQEIAEYEDSLKKYRDWLLILGINNKFGSKYLYS